MATGSVTNLEQVSFAVPKRASMFDIPEAAPTHVGEGGDRIKVVPGNQDVYSVIIAGDSLGDGGEAQYNKLWFGSRTSSEADKFAAWIRTQALQWFYVFGTTDRVWGSTPAGTNVGSVVQLRSVDTQVFLYPYPSSTPPWITEVHIVPDIAEILDRGFQDSAIPASRLQCFRITVPGRRDSDGVRQPELPGGGSIPSFANATLSSVGTLQPTNLSYSRGDPGEIVQVGNANVVVGASKTTETMEGVYTPDTYFNIDDFPLNPIMKLETINDKNFAVTEFESADSVGGKWNIQLQRKITTPIDIAPADATFTPSDSNVQIFDTDNVVNFITTQQYESVNNISNTSIPQVDWRFYNDNRLGINERRDWDKSGYQPIDDFTDWRNETIRPRLGYREGSAGVVLFFSQINSDEVYNIAFRTDINSSHPGSETRNNEHINTMGYVFRQNVPDATEGISLSVGFNPFPDGARFIVSTDKFWRTEERNNAAKRPEPLVQEYWIYSSNVNNFNTLKWADSNNVSSEALQGMINTKGENKFSITGNAAHFEKIVRMIDSPNYLSNTTPGVTDAELAANRAYETTIYLSRLGTLANAAEQTANTYMPRWCKPAPVQNHAIKFVENPVHDEVTGEDTYNSPILLRVRANNWVIQNHEPWSTGTGVVGEDLFGDGDVIAVTRGGFLRTH